MHGFPTLAERALAQPPQNFAEGGLVQRVKQVLGMDPQREARIAAYKQQTAQERMAATPAPVAAPAPAVTDYTGMGAAQRRERAAGLANGGVVRGPGTGTSDSIETEARPGTFIMPADSTEAIGPSALEQMGTVPVRLSDGEFEIPPEQVMALGAAVLKMMKDATHTPVNGVDGGQTDAELAEPAGFAPTAEQQMATPPEQRFADGGLVDPNAPKLGAPVGMPSPATSAMATPPAQATAAPLGWQARNDRRNVEVTASSIMDSPERRAAQATLAAPPTPLAAPAPVGMPAPAAASAPTPLAGGFQSATQRLTAPSLLGQPPQPLSQRPRSFADGGTVEPVGYYDGGLVGEEEKRRLAQIPTGGPAGWTGGGGGSGTPAPSPAPQADDRAVFGFYPQLRDNQRTTHATGNKLAQGVQATPAGFEPATPAAEPPLPPAAARMTNLTDPRSTEFPGSTAAPAPAPAPTPLSDGPLGRAASMSPPAPAPAAQALASGITREGNSYSGPPGIKGDVTINGEAPRNGGAISGQNMAAADSLAGRASQESAARVLGQMPAAPAGFQAPIVRNSTNDWALRKEIDNARTSAASITNTRRWGGKGAENNTDAMELASLLRADGAARGAQPVLDQAAMQERGALSRANLADAGADRRALIAERGANSRADIQAQGLTVKALIDARKSGQPPTGYQWNGSGGLTHIPGGPADPSVRGNKAPLNDVQSKALQFGTRMQEAGGIIDKMATAGVTQPGLIKRGADAIGLGGAANFTQSPEQQQVEQAQRDFINAVLRRESGAAIADSEFSNANKQYFIQPGDSSEVQAQKRRNREIATAGILAEVPDSEKRVGQVVSAANAKAQPGNPAAAGQVPDDVGALLKKYGG